MGGRAGTRRARHRAWRPRARPHRVRDRGTQSESAPPVIELRGLVKRYGNFTAVNGIDLTIARGELFGFLGPNGAGKTTTLRMIAGILEPT
ncbi:MAG TPA: ATP-binding cassette domain-containing protein, partial [Candidatus Elarobacter sp.]|nr:ATP-binding cassette domain-containing protein [Candidatus Elarobacter sp.]